MIASRQSLANGREPVVPLAAANWRSQTLASSAPCFGAALKPQSPAPMWPAWNSSDQFILNQPSSMDVFTDLVQYPIHYDEPKTGSSSGFLIFHRVIC
jgi:hypothetical protein